MVRQETAPTVSTDDRRVMVDDSLESRDLLLVEAEMHAGRLHQIASGAAVVYSSRCPGKESANEDAATIIACDGIRAVLAVADGLGGQPAGQHASCIALEELNDSIRHAVADGTELRDAILNGFENANRAVRALGAGSATTLSVVMIDGQTVRPYHAGDSAILVVGQRGRVKMKTVAHSPVGYAVESGMLEADEAMHHEDRHVVSNTIGSDDMRIELGPVMELSPRDTILLATDGLTDNLHTDEIVETIRKGALTDVSATLCELCGRRMSLPDAGTPCKPDDVSFIVYRACPTASRPSALEGAQH